MRSHATNSCRAYYPTSLLGIFLKLLIFLHSPAPFPWFRSRHFYYEATSPFQRIFYLFNRLSIFIAPCQYYGKHLPELWRERDEGGLSKLWEITSSKSEHSTVFLGSDSISKFQPIPISFLIASTIPLTYGLFSFNCGNPTNVCGRPTIIVRATPASIWWLRLGSNSALEELLVS